MTLTFVCQLFWRDRVNKKTIKNPTQIQCRRVIHAPQRVPTALKNKLRNKLDRIKHLDIIEEVPISGSSEWGNSMAIANKLNGKLRICLEHFDLNEATKRHHHFPTTEKILSKLPHGKVFAN